MNFQAWVLVFALFSFPCVDVLAQAASPNAAVAPTPSVAAGVAVTSSNAIRRDPAGRTGISPSWEAIKRGDDAYVANNLDGAIHEYQTAIESGAPNPIAHVRLASALIAKGDFKQAQVSLDAAMQLAQSDSQLTAKALFVTADLKERQHDLPGALAAWKAYAAFIATHPGIHAFPGSSNSRQAKITAYMKLTEQSAQVKKRIDERLQLLEPEGQKDTKNKKKEDAKGSKQ
jgi:tetratricopeptide (TPR) repeat protein